MRTFEIEISDVKGQLRVARIRCNSQAEAWQTVRLNDGEQAVIREIAEPAKELVKESDPPCKPGTRTAVGSKAPLHPERSGGKHPRPSLFDKIGDLMISCWMSDEMIPESSLDGSRFRPSIFLPASIIPRRALSVLYWLVLVFGAARGFREGRNEQEQPLLAIIYALSGLIGWIVIVALIRYAFFVFPWERRRRMVQSQK
jgi:hypothetical protein